VTIGDDARSGSKSARRALRNLSAFVSILPAPTIGGTLGADRKRASAVRSAGRASIWSRLKLTGATPLAWRLRLDADVAGEEVRALGAAIGKTWIDKIELDCVAPRANEPARLSDPIASLAR